MKLIRNESTIIPIYLIENQIKKHNTINKEWKTKYWVQVKFQTHRKSVIETRRIGWRQKTKMYNWNLLNFQRWWNYSAKRKTKLWSSGTWCKTRPKIKITIRARMIKMTKSTLRIGMKRNGKVGPIDYRRIKNRILLAYTDHFLCN